MGHEDVDSPPGDDPNAASELADRDEPDAEAATSGPESAAEVPDLGAEPGEAPERDDAGAVPDGVAPAAVGWRRWRVIGLIVAFAAVGTVLAVAVAGRVPARLGPFETTVAAVPAWSGETVVRLPPLGTMQLDTHRWPLRLELTVDELPLAEAERIAANPELINTLGDDVDAEVRSALLQLVLRGGLVALGGGLLGALVYRRSWRVAAAGVTTAAVLTVGTAVGTAATFSPQAVSEPRFTGLLTATPTAVGNVENIIEQFGEYRAQLSELVGNVATLYLTAEGLSTFEPTDDTIRLLHVSDIHLNPQAFDLITQVGRQFEIEAVLDTGDITDWGTEPESLIVEEIGDLEWPYVWVRGNHDSGATQRAVAEQPNAIVLDDETVTIAGVRIWGIGDPRFTPNKEEIEDTATQIRLAEEFAPHIGERLSAAQPPAVDLAMVHDPRIAAEFGGRVPVVLAGHRHDPQEIDLEDGTVILAEGSTGGAGFRALQGEVAEPLVASVLYFDPEVGRVLALDRISLQGLGGAGATIERRVLEEVEEDEDDDDDEDDDEDVQ